MSKKIEAGCLATTISDPLLKALPEGALVRVLSPVTYEEMGALLVVWASHCGSCQKFSLSYLDKFDIHDHWSCEFESMAPAGVRGAAPIPERLLRRLPPPDIEKLITSKDASAQA
jgi:hypothetical protein